MYYVGGKYAETIREKSLVSARALPQAPSILAAPTLPYRAKVSFVAGRELRRGWAIAKLDWHIVILKKHVCKVCQREQRA